MASVEGFMAFVDGFIAFVQGFMPYVCSFSKSAIMLVLYLKQPKCLYLAIASNPASYNACLNTLSLSLFLNHQLHVTGSIYS